jgi:putative transcriptional regulator
VSSLQSHLLVASADMPEPFTRAVVLLVRHNQEGALGLILNRRTTALLKETWAKLSEVPCHRDEAIFLGGPCEGPLVALHPHEFLLEIEVMPGLYFSAGKDKLERLASQKDGPPIKFFAGYSGWSPGQLEGEIARGSWSVMPAKPEHAFAFEDEMWTQATRQVAGAAWRSALNIKHAPPDPSCN